VRANSVNRRWLAYIFQPVKTLLFFNRHTRLTLIIDWDGLEADLSHFYCAGTGRLAGSVRLMTGLCFLKDIEGLSDEEVCAVWCENPYFQHFCGETFFQHRFPVEPPSLSIFPGRIGEAGAVQDQRSLELSGPGDAEYRICG